MFVGVVCEALRHETEQGGGHKTHNSKGGHRLMFRRNVKCSLLLLMTGSMTWHDTTSFNSPHAKHALAWGCRESRSAALVLPSVAATATKGCETT